MRKKEPGIHPDENLRRKCGGQRVLCLRGRRRGYPCSTKAARAGVSGQRMAAHRRCESTAVDLRTWFAGRSASAWDMLQARTDFKTMGFGGVLWVLSAADGRKYPAVGKTRVRCRGIADVPVAADKISALPYVWRTPPILTAATGSGPPSCQPIPGHCRGRQSGHFLEIASLILPQAALRRFPCFIRHQRRSDRFPRARSALAMTGFLQEVPPKTVRARSVDSRVKPCG